MSFRNAGFDKFGTWFLCECLAISADLIKGKPSSSRALGFVTRESIAFSKNLLCTCKF